MFKFLMPKVKNVEQAKEAYKKYACKGSNCGKLSFVIDRWNELIYPKLTKIISDRNAWALLQIMEDIPPYGKAEVAAHKAFQDFGASLILTPGEAKELYLRFLKININVAKMIESRWDDLSLSELEKANNALEIEAVAEAAPYGERAFRATIEKRAGLCQTVKEVDELSQYLYKKRSQIQCPEMDLRPLKKRLNEIIIDEIPKTNDISTLEKYYGCASKDSSAKPLAFEKWLSLCTTPEEADEAYKIAYQDDMPECQKKAYERVKALSHLNS